MASKLTSRGGFTVAEVVLALALVSVTVLTLMGLCLRTLQANRKNVDTGMGQLVAEQAIEQIAMSAEASATAPVWASNSAVVAYSSDTVQVAGTTFQVTTYATDVAPTVFVATKRLKRLQTRVVWKDLQQGKMGYGNLRAESTRLVHEP